MFNFKKNIKVVLILGLLFLPVFVFAQNRATIDISIPCISCDYADNPSPVGLIANFYEMAIALSGVLALGMIIYAGIKRIVGAGSPKEVSDSNDIIYNALLGIVLLFGAYILLNTINPQLTKLEIPTLSQIEVKESSDAVASSYQCNADADGIKAASCHDTMEDCVNKCSALARDKCRKVAYCAVSSGSCPIGDIPPITDPEALAMENGAKVIWTASAEPAKSNLIKLKAEFNKLQTELSKIGASATANSVYRPLAYQKHFYDIKTAHDRFLSLTPTQRADCVDFEKALRAEEAKHGICPSKTEQCVVSPPSPSAPHVRGTGIDITLSGIKYSEINKFMSARGIKLSWQGIPNDEWHFNLR